MNSLLFSGLIGIGVALSNMARAEILSFTIDPEKSSVTASGDAASYPIQQQGPGSLVTKLAGTLHVDVAGNSITFDPATTIDALVNGNWQPLPGGQGGSAPADFAGQANVGFFNVKAAFRDVALNASSPIIPLDQNGTFDVAQLLFFFPTNSTSTFDFDAGLIDRGTRSLAGVESDSISGTGSISTNGNTQTITIPFSGTFTFSAIDPDDSELILNGQIVATRTTTVPTRIDTIQFENGALTVTFSSSPEAQLQLQSSTDLKTWTPVTAGVTMISPGVYRYTATTDQPLTFFRLQRIEP